MKITSMKGVDEKIGNFLIRLLSFFKSSKTKQIPENPKNVLFIKFWGIGSLLLAEPSISKFKEKFPNCKIYILTLSQNKELEKLLPNVERFFTVKLGDFDEFFFSSTLAWKKLRKINFDIVFDLEFFANFSTIFGFLLKQKVLKGFTHKQKVTKEKLLDFSTIFDEQMHTSLNFLKLVISEDQTKIEKLRTQHKKFPQENLFKVQELLGNFEFGKNFIVVNPNASQLAFERRWDFRNFAELINKITSQNNCGVILIGSQNEMNYVKMIQNLCNSREQVLNLAGKLELLDLAVLLSQAEILVTNDSGPMHLGTTVGTKIVGLFGPETPLRYSPLGEKKSVIYKNLECSPCMSVNNSKTVNCIYEFPKCMESIEVSEVFREVTKFFSKS